MRNVYVASAPDFKATRITKFLKDDGVDIGSVRLSDDGSMAMFIRGSGQNRDGWVANPSHDPRGGERAVWAAKTDGSGAWRLAKIENTEAPPASDEAAARRSSRPTASGWCSRATVRSIARARRAAPTAAWTRPASRSSRSGDARAIRSGARRVEARLRLHAREPLVHRHLGHEDRKVEFMSPSTDFDNSPTWSADGKRIAFIRRPGTPFGQQVANGAAFGQTRRRPRRRAAAPAGAAGAVAAAADVVTRWRWRRRVAQAGARERMPARCGGGRGGGGGGGRSSGADTMPFRSDGLCRAAFAGGYTLEFMVADVATGKAQQFWHNQPGDRTFNAINFAWAGDHVVFSAQVPRDEWDRYFSVSIANPQPSRRC